jgi:hypothetical protein
MALRERFLLILAAIGIASLLHGLSPAQIVIAAATPELPRLYVDTAQVPSAGRVIAVPATGNLQIALNAANPGDVITLEAGATFTGPFTIPNKPGTGWITIRTSAPDGSLPPPGTRVTPAYAAVMPKLVAATGSVLTTAPGAHHYRFIGIEIRPKERTFLYSLVQLGTTETSTDQLPHHIIFDRCYLHGDPEKGTRRGITMNAGNLAVIDSHLADFKEVGADSQAIAGWNGPGPFKIVNNYLEAATENVMFGGTDPSIPNLVPSDIEIRQNHFFKPLSWRVGDPSYAGTRWSIKNLFELKNARRVLIEGNVFEQIWGFAILFTPRNQGGAAPWSVVEDVTFQRNIVRHAGGGINMLGWDNEHPSQQTKRILIKDNLFDDINAATWGGDGRLFQLLVGVAEVAIDHNTAFQSGPIIMAEGKPHTDFVYRNNLTSRGNYGVIGTGTGIGNPTLTTYFPEAVFVKNVLVGDSAADYPPGNFFPAALDAVGFLDRTHGNYRLAASSQYRKAGTDGKDLGADLDAIANATTGETR